MIQKREELKPGALIMFWAPYSAWTESSTRRGDHAGHLESGDLCFVIAASDKTPDGLSDNTFVPSRRAPGHYTWTYAFSKLGLVWICMSASGWTLCNVCGNQSRVPA